jgi:Core-2/I-Branching enzyme
MKVVFLILMHKNSEQTIRLIERLDSPASIFIVHVDRRASDAIYRPMVAWAARHNRVHLAKRCSCRWGGFGIVAATLECLRAALRLGQDFDYAMLLSGQDYLIKPLAAVFEFLRAQRGKQFIEVFRIDLPNRWSGNAGAFEPTHRVFWYHLAFRSRWIHVPIRRGLPYGMKPYGGSQWWCLTYECVAAIDKVVRSKPKVLRYFRNVFIPDEIIFQTIVSNSRFAGDVLCDDLHYADWTRPNPWPPRILDASDFERIRSSGKLFARKFDIAHDRSVLDKIDRELLFMGQ